MSTITSRLKYLRKKGIKFFSNVLAENIATRVVDLLLGVLIGGGTLTAIFLFLRDALWNPTIKLLLSLLTIKIELWLVLLFAFFLALLLFFYIRLSAWLKSPVFLDVMGTKVKINSETGRVERQLYCIKHKAPFIYRARSNSFQVQEVYLCPICYDETSKEINSKMAELIYDIAQGQIEAIKNKGIERK